MYTGLTLVNEWGKAGLSHFEDSRTWDKVAAREDTNGDSDRESNEVAEMVDKIAGAASAMGPEFVEWLLISPALVTALRCG